MRRLKKTPGEPQDTRCPGTLQEMLRPSRITGLVLGPLSAVQALLSVSFALATRRVIDSAIGQSEDVIAACLLFGALAIGIPLLRGAVQALAVWRNDRTVAMIRRDFLAVLERKDCEALGGFHSAYLFSRVTADTATVCGKYATLRPSVVGQGVQLVGAMAALLLLKPALAGIVLLCGCAMGLCGLLLRKILKGIHLKLRSAGEKVSAAMQESLEHLEVHRSILAENEVIQRFSLRQEAWLRICTRLRRVSIGGSTLFSLVLQCASAVLIVWGAFSIRGGNLTYGELTAILQLVNLFRSPVSSLTGLQSQLAAVDAAEERIMELWNLPDEPTGEEIPKDAVLRAVVLEHVTFSYAGEETPVFSDFSARIPFGEWTCLTGVSGRGKSTLFRLVLGLYHPQSGRIFVETDRGNYPCCAAARRVFGFVPQEPILFSGTLRENLLLAKPEAEDEELRAVLERAACGFVRDLPNGLDTELGETGAGLSVGQKQRVAVARALLSGAGMLLLDEISSALDRETERQLVERLAAACPSVLITTHRPDGLDGVKMRHLHLD